jgi:hypothetical protein
MIANQIRNLSKGYLCAIENQDPRHMNGKSSANNRQ